MWHLLLRHTYKRCGDNNYTVHSKIYLWNAYYWLQKNVSEYKMSLALGHSKGYIQSISSGRTMPVTASDWSRWRDLNIWKYETLKFTILDISDFLSSDKLVSHTKYNPYFSTKTLIQPLCLFQGFLGLKALCFYAERPCMNVCKFGLKYKNLNVLKGFVSLSVTHHFSQVNLQTCALKRADCGMEYLYSA